jgi:hypothetical protein
MFKTATLLLFSVSALAGEPKIASNLPKVDVLELGVDFDTPTCDASTKAGTYFAVSYDQDVTQRVGAMKLDGKKVEFKLAGGQKDLWDYETAGVAIQTKYVSGNLTLELNGQVTKDCSDPNDDSCEYVEMTLDATLSNGVDSVDLKGLTGGCGV